MKPKISVVIPCYNEEDTITLLLEALYQQTFPKEFLEILIIDGVSSDNTINQIKWFTRNHSDLNIKVISNPERIIPVALNKGIQASTGELIIRLDAHSQPYPDYIERCVLDIQNIRADNVGGIWEIKPGNDNWVGKGIARASSHPLGVGDARYRVGGEAQYVETVPFGCFNKKLFEKVGFFDEKLLTNEDYEFNNRILKSGGKIWFDPTIKSIYYSRKTFRELANQYWRYGYWKGKMILKNPATLRWRQVIPPLFVLSLLLWLVLSFFDHNFLILLTLEITLYLLALLVIAAIEAIKNHDSSYSFGMPIAMIIMHVCWGTSFVWSLITNYGKSKD